MNNTALLTIAAILLILLATGCDRRIVNVPTDPNDVSSNEADWVLAFRYESTLSAGDFYRIELYSTADKQKDISDSIVEITVGDSIIPLIYHNYPAFFKGWSADDAHLLDEEQIIELRIDGEREIYTNVKPVNKASAAFPVEYDYQQSLTLNWAVASGNQYQYVKAEAWSADDGGNSPYSSYVKQVSTNSRSHIFPANCIALIGAPENTTFVLTVQEINYIVLGKSAVMVYQEEGYGYWDNNSKSSYSVRKTSPVHIHKMLSN